MNNLALLISGGGTTATAVVRAVQERMLTGIGEIIGIASTPEANGIFKLRQLGIHVAVVQRNECVSQEEFGKSLLTILEQHKISIVSQNGWLPLTPKQVVEHYKDRIINQHPGPLDPQTRRDFGGKGMFGKRVVAARLIYCWLTGSDYWTEAVTHHVFADFDDGDIIQVMKVDLPQYQTTFAELEKNPSYVLSESEKVHKRLLPVEHENVIATLQYLVNRSTPSFVRGAALVPKEHESVLHKAKQLAIKLYPDG
ncbi:MAG: formyltransferase family protein [Patescibacteria group bacterium]